MANTHTVMIYWGGHITNDRFGTSYEGGGRKIFKIKNGTSLAELKNKIASKIGMSRDQEIVTLTFRMPVASSGTMHFSSVQIDDQDELQMVYEIQQSLQYHHVIEIYVDIGSRENVHQAGNFEEQGVDLSTPNEEFPHNTWCASSSQLEDTSLLGWFNPTNEQYNMPAFNIGGSASMFGYNDGAGPSNYRIHSPSRHSVDVQPSMREDTTFPRYSVDAGPSSSRQYSVPCRSVNVRDVQDDEEYDIEWSSDSYDDPEFIPSDDDHPDQVQQVPLLDLNEPASYETGSSSQYPVRMDMLEYRDLNRMEVNEEDSFVAFGQSSDEAEIKKGMKFDNKDQVIAAVKRYSVRHHKNHRVTESKPDLFTAVCKKKDDGCPWKIRATKKWLTRKWEITRLAEEHTCMAETLTTDHPSLDSNLLAMEVEHLVRADIKVRIKVLQEEVDKKYGYMPSYRRTLMAKDRAIQKLYGQWDESYNRLPRFFNALLAKNPRSVIVWHYFNHSPDGTSIVYTQDDTFHRVFWSFFPCIMAFKHCRPVLCVDATFLYGKYRGTLLIATAVDGGQQIIPVAFAIVENESESTWHWFLSNIKQYITFSRRLCVVSDRHVGLMNVMGRHRVWGEGEASHRICARHLAANCVKNFKHVWLRGTITSLGNLLFIFLFTE